MKPSLWHSVYTNYYLDKYFIILFIMSETDNKQDVI